MDFVKTSNDCLLIFLLFLNETRWRTELQLDLSRYKKKKKDFQFTFIKLSDCLIYSVCKNCHFAGQVGGIARESYSFPFGRGRTATYSGTRSNVDGPTNQYAGQRLFGNFDQDT